MRSGASRSHLLLTELILDLAIFTVCAVVCACILVRASVISKDSTALTGAVTAAQNAAEEWRAGADWCTGGLSQALSAEKQFDSSWSVIPAGQAFAPTSSRAVSYTLTLREDRSEAGLRTAQIDVCGSASQTLLYTLTVSAAEEVGP